MRIFKKFTFPFKVIGGMAKDKIFPYKEVSRATSGVLGEESKTVIVHRNRLGQTRTEREVERTLTPQEAAALWDTPQDVFVPSK